MIGTAQARLNNRCKGSVAYLLLLSQLHTYAHLPTMMPLSHHGRANLPSMAGIVAVERTL